MYNFNAHVRLCQNIVNSVPEENKKNAVCFCFCAKLNKNV